MKAAAITAALAATLVCSGAETLDERYANIATNVCEALKMVHVTRQAPDDVISRRAFTNLLEGCDSEHMVFSAEDVEEFAKSIDSLDDMIKRGDFSFALRMRKLYRERLAERVAFATNLLAKASFRFDKGKRYEQDRRDTPWPKAGRERDEAWNSRIENQVLDALVSCETGKVESAAASVSQMYSDMLATESKRGQDTQYDDFLIAIAAAYDAHTIYMTPVMEKMFNSQMSLSMCGIGLQWVLKDGAMKVVRVLPNGAAAKDGRIHAGDRIVGVASKGTNEIVRVAGMKELDLLNLFQGADGEPITVEIEHANGKIGKYTLKREKMEMEDEAAASKVVEVNIGGKKRKVGYLRLPSFYATAPSKGDGFRSSSEDVRTELRKLKKEGICGLLFDLRGNCGGSLDDAVKIIGLFVRRGPGVRMKGMAGEVTLPVLEGTVECEEPMVVLTSNTSASAGELVPATLQDYGRAVIVGDKHTFGKGSAQTVASLDMLSMTQITNMAQIANMTKSLGSLVITEGRFYRITGGSTQIRGVISDIEVPSIRYDNKGESGLKYPLPWNTIASVPFERCWDLEKFVPELRSASEIRRSKSATWKRHAECVRWSQDMVARKSVPLDLKLRKEQKARDEATYNEMNRLDMEGFNPAKRDADAVLDEGLNILADLVQLNGGRRLPEAKEKKGNVTGLFEGLDDDD